MPATIENEVQQLTSHSESIVNDALKVFGKEWMPRDVSFQGDLCIVCLPSMPEIAKPRRNRQMADGDTQGSRHIVKRGKCFDADAAEVARLIESVTKCKVDPKYVGPVFKGPAYLAHPEHGDQQWTGECINSVVYQRALDAEEREQRVRD